MEQKLFRVEFNGREWYEEVEFPPELKDLLNNGWRIVQISSYVLGNDCGCVLLLQRELTDKETQ